MKKVFFLFLFITSCTLLNIKTSSNEAIFNSKLSSLYTKLEKTNKRIDSLVSINHPKLKRDNENNIIRPDGITLSGRPIYYKSYHGKSQVDLLKADKVKNNLGPLGLDLNGEGIQVHVWDSKSIFKTHIEFVDSNGNTIIERSPSESQKMEDYHGTSVVSTIIANGVLHDDRYDVTGLAPKLSKLKYFNSTNDEFEILQEHESNPDFIISNHSYGYYIFNDEGLQQFDAWEIGEYGEWDQFIDEASNLFPYWIYIQGTGNEGDLSYDGQEHSKYDYLVDGLNAKNQLNVASINLIQEFGDFISPSGFSSAGPTNDFRIKPEIAALGSDVICAYWDEDEPTITNKYAKVSGTSFSGPAVAGGIALLQQHYKNLKNAYMRSSTVKALVCHTATDIASWGSKSVIGPDPKTGYGLFNVEKAVEVIQSTVTEPILITEKELSNGSDHKLTFVTDTFSDEPLIVTLAWNDPYKKVLLTQGDLVNDLDIRVYNGTETFYPWKLDRNDMTAPAIKGDNLVDNLEKIEIDNPAGSYTIEVSHKGTLLENQIYSLIISGNGSVLTLSSDFQKARLNKIISSFNRELDQIDVYQKSNTYIFKSFALYDISGRLIESSPLNDVSLFKINASKLNSGIYILEVNTNSARFTTKVVLK